MAATYDIPIPQTAETGFHVASVFLNYDETIILVNIKRDPDRGIEVLRVGQQRDVDAGRAEFTFAQFVALLPGAATLNTNIEQKLIDIGRFPAGTVT